MSDQGAPIESMDAEQAQAEITRLSGDADFQKHLMSGNGLGHREASAVWRGLLEKAHSGKPAEHETSSPDGAEASAGAPASPDEYRITRDYSVPDWDNELEAEAKQLAHTIGLSNGELEGVVLAWNAAAADVRTNGPITPEKALEGQKTGMAALTQKHGARTGEVVAKARSVIDSLPHTEKQRFVELLEVSGLGNSPYVIDQLAIVADRKGGPK
jgi:hypothetical protein